VEGRGWVRRIVDALAGSSEGLSSSSRWHRLSDWQECVRVVVDDIYTTAHAVVVEVVVEIVAACLGPVVGRCERVVVSSGVSWLIYMSVMP
jgi:hypothetical protein